MGKHPIKSIALFFCNSCNFQNPATSSQKSVMTSQSGGCRVPQLIPSSLLLLASPHLCFLALALPAPPVRVLGRSGTLWIELIWSMLLLKKELPVLPTLLTFPLLDPSHFICSSTSFTPHQVLVQFCSRESHSSEKMPEKRNRRTSCWISKLNKLKEKLMRAKAVAKETGRTVYG